jgi:hypothetical protein
LSVGGDRPEHVVLGDTPSGPRHAVTDITPRLTTREFHQCGYEYVVVPLFVGHQV